MDASATGRLPIETVHIGNTSEITMRELAEKLFAIARWHPKIFDIKPSPPGSVKRRLGDIKKIRNLVGWKPETSLDKGLKQTFTWYQEHPPLL